MTLTPLDDARRLNSPPLQGRGRGWGLSANRLALLQERAASMRSNPAEPEKRLWSRLSRAQLGGFKFRRQAVISNFIVDFLCPARGLAIEVDGDTHDPVADARRDTVLTARGIRVLRVSNTDVMRNIEGVLEHILATLHSSPLPFRGGAGGGGSPPAAELTDSPHPNPSPEGEGLDAVEARKLRGVSLEGSVG